MFCILFKTLNILEIVVCAKFSQFDIMNMPKKKKVNHLGH